MLKKHLCIFIVHFFFPFSKPSPSILVESGGATALGDKFIKIETSVKEIRTPISKIPFIEQQVINDKIFGARNIAIYADFHKTLISPDGKNWKQIHSLITEVSKYANILISSRGRNEKMVFELKDIPRIIISEELGMKVTIGGKTKNPYHIDVKDFETIKQITYDVIKCAMNSWNIDTVEDVKKSFVFSKTTYKMDFPQSLSKIYRSKISRKVEEAISSNKAISHWGTSFSDGDSIRYFASKKCSKLNVLKDYLLSTSDKYDMMISLGNGDADEEVHKFMNKNNFLSILVRNEGEKKKDSFAQYRVNDHLSVYQILEKLIDLKKKQCV
ncbi:hypothetical protein BY996DRAFT_4159492 [Phakopsora pachyrhizi]|uniref:Expressed protein n=1 Tax=Phakopsora pachyrhizi TaxID=170000 RepID=A0AAV0BA72_PHAPC|nr:hypothetical protein BY996DRAFT_4159492 [Phakopsora pachyrhizi]CAH7682650.1 expressed protein [Phakopsora pachyrhizi]